ncbi:MAG: MBL fold metallo-hydrolase [Acidobacteriia bacterium]|nr:MBL fold metallo-hydrolase [Terriglobia bacterium]
MVIKLTSYGACGEVTGSLHMLSFDEGEESLKILLDAGAFQGLDSEELNGYLPHSINPQDIRYIFLSHSHFDHCGRLPMLVKRGFTGKIISTPVTRDLAFIILDDMLKIQKGKQQEKENGNGIEKTNDGKDSSVDDSEKDLGLLFSEKDVERTKQLFTPIPMEFGDWESDDGKLKVEFVNSEHIIGGVSIKITKPISLLYTGDLGGGRSSLHEIPSPVGKGNEIVDYLIIESTYGNREIEKSDALSLQNAIEYVKESGGRLLIPVLAVDRAEELLHLIKDLGVKEKVYFDTPLGLEVLEIYTRNRYDLPKIAKKLEQYGEYQGSIHYLAHGLSKTLQQGKGEVDFKEIFKPAGFEKVISNKKSMEIAGAKFPCIIIASSGMLEGGRIMRYLPGILEDNRNIVLFTSYQGEGTLGRQLIDGEKEVHVNYKIKNTEGEIEDVSKKVFVNASIRRIEGLSAHADKNDLLEYINKFRILPKKIFVVHGETDASESLKSEIERKFRVETIVSQFNVSYELSESATNENVITKDITNIDVLRESKIVKFENRAGKIFAPYWGFIVDNGNSYKLVSQDEMQKNLLDALCLEKDKLLPVEERSDIGEEFEGPDNIIESKKYVDVLIKAFDDKIISKGLIKQLKDGIEKGKSEYLYIIDNKLSHDVLIARQVDLDKIDVKIDREKTNDMIATCLRRGAKLNIRFLKESIDKINEKLRDR